MLKWRQIQKDNFTKLEDLGKFLDLDLSYSSSFPLNVPRRLASKIKKRTLDDPILKQFLPSLEEDLPPPSFLEDPVCDTSFQKTPRLLQKYQGRALLITTSACAMHCRYCFRQNYPYNGNTDFHSELEIIRSDETIHEIILSGGDPLSLSDETLKPLIESLSEIPHLKLLRFHTRFPIGIPERITDSLLELLENSRLQVVFIVHVNHPDELDDEIFSALKKVGTLGIPILCQSVLLAGVNDDDKTLKELFLSLAHRGIIPYYLHQLDRVKQGHHFEVPVEKGLKLIEKLRGELPGYALPKYVQEIPFKNSKTDVTSDPLSLDRECKAPV
ncbi:MAG: KamA family radical SAM protein [Simkaniaceae bacterium]|nr:MAG: KamA family radical SAM protein [Simkaniaceae bacterium]